MGGRLVILRGNSGSGKSTKARMLRDAAGGRVALIEQDYLRRIVLKEGQGTDNIDLIEATVVFALEREYDVVLEGRRETGIGSSAGVGVLRQQSRAASAE